MYQIKACPEDFLVKEVADIKISKGQYIYFKLKKTNYNTLDAIEQISKELHIPLSKFGYSGNKDKNAITEQFVSITGVSKEKLENLSLDNIQIQVIGTGKKYISLGDHIGNEFIITMRNITKKDIETLKKKSLMMPNLFGEQRFSKNNAEVGKAIIKRDFKLASELLNLDVIEKDYIGAIRKVNKKILRLLIHSYQSEIFNKIAEKAPRLNKDMLLPIIGFGTEVDSYEIKDIINDVLKEENLTPRDFITVKMPELSEEGDNRPLYVEIKNFKIMEEKQDMVKISFFLKKGSYATEAVKYLLS